MQYTCRLSVRIALCVFSLAERLGFASGLLFLFWYVLLFPFMPLVR